MTTQISQVPILKVLSNLQITILIHEEKKEKHPINFFWGAETLDWAPPIQLPWKCKLYIAIPPLREHSRVPSSNFPISKP